MKTSVDGKSAVHQSSPLALKRKRNGNLPVGGAGGGFLANGTVCNLIAPQQAGTLVAVISLSRRMRLKHLLKHLLVLRLGATGAACCSAASPQKDARLLFPPCNSASGWLLRCGGNVALGSAALAPHGGHAKRAL